MIFIRGARQLLTLRGPSPRRGIQLSDLGVIPDGALLIDGSKIREVGSTRRIENLAAARSAKVIDASGKVVLPGFVDSHTRLVFSAPPLRQFEAHIAGTNSPHSDLMAGVPLPMVPSIRTISPKALRLKVRRWAFLFAAHGTTTVEARLAHGLNLSSELKGLRVARSLDGDPLDVVSTFLAGSPESSDLVDKPDAALERVTELLLPIIRRRRLADFCDVDCDPNAFSVEQSRRILHVARQLGFRLKVQADRTVRGGGVRLAVEMRATGADHLQHINEDDIDRLADSSTVATVLPGVVYHQERNRVAPARQLVDRGAAVALATGFGPTYGTTCSMPMVLSLACMQMRMGPEEAISAATINGAAAIDRAHLLGSLEPGKQADVAMFDVGDYREIPYYFGVNLCIMTMKKGRIIYRAAGPSPSPPVPTALPEMHHPRPSQRLPPPGSRLGFAGDLDPLPGAMAEGAHFRYVASSREAAE